MNHGFVYFWPSNSMSRDLAEGKNPKFCCIIYNNQELKTN